MKDLGKIFLQRGVLIIILVIGFINRLLFLFQPIRYDEAFNFIVFASSFPTIISNYSLPNNHILHTIFVFLSNKLLNCSYPCCLRLPAFIAGCLLPLLVYFIGKSIYDKPTALFCSGLVSSSSILIEYSTNARGYTMIILFFLLILYSIEYFLKKGKNKKGWSFFILFSVLGLYTIPIMVYPLLTAIFWFLFTLKEKNENLNVRNTLVDLLKALGIIFLLVFILYSPVIIKSGFAPFIKNRFILPHTFSTFIKELQQTLLKIWEQWNRDIPLYIRIILGLSLVISLIFNSQLRKKHFCLSLSAILAAFLILFFMRRVAPARCYLYSLPLYLMMLSASFVWSIEVILNKIRTSFHIRDYIIYFFLLCFILIISYSVIKNKSIIYSQETGSLRSAEKIVLDLKNILRKGDCVVSFCPADAILAYYFYLHQIPSAYFQFSCLRDFKKIKRIFIIVRDDQNLETLLRRYAKRLLFLKNSVLKYRYEDAKVYLYTK